MSEATAPVTLREQLSAGLDAIEAEANAPEAGAIADRPNEASEPSPAAQASRINGRDDKGRFTTPKGGDVPTEKAAAEMVPETAAEPPKRPSSWKKEMWAQYDGLAPEVRDYILQRENETAAGLAPLKQEIETAKPLRQAVEQFLPDIQQLGVSPAQFVQNLGMAHRVLTQGSPQQKVGMLQRLASDYGVPLEALAGQPAQPGQPGQPDPQLQWITEQVQGLSHGWNQFQQSQAQAQQQSMQAQIDAFAADPAHAHFLAVKQTMAGLLQAGLAPDLQTAYDKAIRMHDDIWQKEQARQAEAQAAEAARKQTETVAKAKAIAVSPKGSSPSGKVIAAQPTDRRAQIADALDALGARI